MPRTPIVAKYDDRTSRGWPLPHWKNKLSIDSQRLRETLTKIDEAVTTLEGEISSFPQDIKTAIATFRTEALQNGESLQSQLNDLAFSEMWRTICDNELRGRIFAQISDIKDSIEDIYSVLGDTGVMTYKGARVAAKNEISDMLNDILSGSDDGEISVSEIPEELKDEIADHKEITEILDEVFPNRS